MPKWASIFLFFCTVLCSNCDRPEVPATPHIDQAPYRFFVAGHVYGDQAHADTSFSPYPPFLRALPRLQQDPLLHFGVLLGDQVADPVPIRYDSLFAHWSSSSFAHPDFRCYAVPGNHDMQWLNGTALPGLYDAYWGPRFHSFRHRGSLFLFLDSNEHHWRILDSQKEMLQRELQRAPLPHNVFLFVHNILWWDADSTSQFHYPTPNSTWNRFAPTNFHSELLPLLQEVGVPVYCFAGDTGFNCNGRELTWHQAGQVALITTGMGCPSQSNFIEVEIDQTGKAELIPVGIGSDDLGTLADWSY